MGQIVIRRERESAEGKHFHGFYPASDEVREFGDTHWRDKGGGKLDLYCHVSTSKRHTNALIR